MIQPTTKQLERALADVDGIVRRLAVVLRGISDFGAFFKALEDVYAWVSAESGRSIRLDLPGGSCEIPDDSFEAAELTVPVGTRSGSAGFIRIAPPAAARPFGPGDLHLLGALAEFTGALLEVSEVLRESRKLRELFQLVYDQLPVGVLCFGRDGSVLLRNARVPIFGGTDARATRDEVVSALETLGTRREAVEPNHLQYVIAVGSGSWLVDLRRMENAAAGLTVVTFGELAADRQALHDRLAREVYRCRWLGLPLTLVVLRAGPDLTPLLSRLPEFRRQLGTEAVCDVLDGTTIGLIVPESVPREALRAARQVSGLGGLKSLNIGWSALEEGAGDPENLLKRALANLRPAGDLLARRLLVFDRYPAITNMIELVVRGDFHVDKTTDASIAGKLLEGSPYDGLIAECEPEEGDPGTQLIDTAGRCQPGIRTIVTTTRIDLRPGVHPVPGEALVLNKPFTVPGLRAGLRSLLDRTATG